MIQEAIRDLIAGADLDRAKMRAVMEQIMSGQATDAQIGAFLVALRIKGETIDEIAGGAEVMREKATPIVTVRPDLIDTCGTGGDDSGTFNISTTVAFVACGAGLAVAKHGTRSISSQCGSSDVLTALGVNVEAAPEKVGECIDEVGIGFLFAIALHGAMKHAIGPRRELATRTVFNILGPLTNPAGAKRQLLGVFDGALTEALAGVLRELGSDQALVVHGSDGLDEITLTGPTQVSELRDGHVSTRQIHPGDFGLQTVSAEALKGGDADHNARILRGVLDGEEGPQRDVVLLNAAAAMVVGGLAEDITAGLEVARESIDSGTARHALDRLVEVSNS
ncbi:MAG: anthranilate phosphoribosyltransferase [Gemmatimonadetes bacterium]|nr:anthranilate phosphoribosyltransferase [Gemmatimonadota bacterium]MXY82192.1 anthranilate phosphoribosyltransferase [Gemmatimonadota bacterium]MYB67244.1 anthranilate phosphoribosyltransferase [Gemmatimonadota bacterium]